MDAVRNKITKIITILFVDLLRNGEADKYVSFPLVFVMVIVLIFYTQVHDAVS